MTADNPRARAIGGVFFRSTDPAKTREWYRRHLGLRTDAYGTNFAWRQAEHPDRCGYTQWSPFAQETSYFGAREQQFMINFRVEDLEGLLTRLQTDGVEVVGDVQQESYGKFAHIVDVDGRRVELWEPIDDEYEKLLDGLTS